MQTRGRAMKEREAAVAEREKRVAQREAAQNHSTSVLRRREDDAAEAVAKAREQAAVMEEMGAQLNSFNARALLEPKTNLLSLPIELRTEIYRFVMARKPQRIVSGQRTRCKDNKSSHWHIRDGEPRLARTCKLVRQEILPLFYAETTFILKLIHTAEYERSEYGAWETSLRQHASGLRRIQLERGMRPYGSRPHPTKPGVEIKSPRFEAKVTLTKQGTMEIDCSLISHVAGPPWDLPEVVERYCACHFHRLARASAAQGVDGRRLLVLAQACIWDVYPAVTGAVCEGCGLPSVDITKAEQRVAT
ncbi:hypothetical protein B0A55_04696 [Friedmanniomyces simplex]|uniref:F-box domain-containing protein n=1 Tax=Friedmanniomyces simplex TaxID=329884 RepID=A0A4U0XKM6_9PEZI|nr:hypothetical protein B0A55_04696 [Friedmanniomyces simplex]